MVRALPHGPEVMGRVTPNSTTCLPVFEVMAFANAIRFTSPKEASNMIGALPGNFLQMAGIYWQASVAVETCCSTRNVYNQPVRRTCWPSKGFTIRADCLDLCLAISGNHHSRMLLQAETCTGASTGINITLLMASNGCAGQSCAGRPAGLSKDSTSCACFFNWSLPSLLPPIALNLQSLHPPF